VVSVAADEEEEVEELVEDEAGDAEGRSLALDFLFWLPGGVTAEAASPEVLTEDCVDAFEGREVEVPPEGLVCISDHAVRCSAAVECEVFETLAEDCSRLDPELCLPSVEAEAAAAAACSDCCLALLLRSARLSASAIFSFSFSAARWRSFHAPKLSHSSAASPPIDADQAS
jgi:hypothetical protein